MCFNLCIRAILSSVFLNLQCTAMHPSGKCSVISFWGGKKVLIYSIWWFPWHKYCGHGWLQASNMALLNAGLRRDTCTHGHLGSWLQHIALCINPVHGFICKRLIIRVTVQFVTTASNYTREHMYRSFSSPALSLTSVSMLWTLNIYQRLHAFPKARLSVQQCEQFISCIYRSPDYSPKEWTSSL